MEAGAEIEFIMNIIRQVTIVIVVFVYEFKYNHSTICPL